MPCAPRTTVPQVGSICGGASRLPVKPSAQPTLVRTQHLPPPAKTAHGLGFVPFAGHRALCHRVSSAVSGRRCTALDI